MLTGEESIDQLQQFAMQGGRGAFFFLRWVHHRAKAHKIAQKSAETDNVMNDACSRYRGGYYNPANESATKGMMSDLSGGKASTGQPFVFMGDKSDLSVFWQVVTPERQAGLRKFPEVRVSVPRSMIEDIPDGTVRSKVLSVFTKARADGLLGFDGRVYSLTDAGKRYILKSDFVISRLNAEYDFFSRAHTQYESAAADQRAAQKESWIDAQLRERGIDWQQRWPDRNRVSVDRAALDAQRVNDSWQLFVPGTHRGMRISVPASDVVELNEKTLVAFLDPTGMYADVSGGKQVSGKVLMSHFDDRTVRNTTRHPSEKAVENAAGNEFTPGVNMQPPENAKLSVGQTVYAPDQFSNSLELHSYKIDRALEDSAGNIWYKLSGNSLSSDNLPDQLLPEDALGKFLFTSGREGVSYFSTHEEQEIIDYADELLARTMGEIDTAGAPIKSYTLAVDQAALVSENNGICRIRIPGKQAEQLVIPLSDVEKLDGKLQIALRSDRSYDVITGAYRYSASGDGIAKLSGAKETEIEQINLSGEITPEEVSVKSGEPAVTPKNREVRFPLQKSDIIGQTKDNVIIRSASNDQGIQQITIPKNTLKSTGDGFEVILRDNRSYFAQKGDGISIQSGRQVADLMNQSANSAVHSGAKAAASTAAAGTSASNTATTAGAATATVTATATASTATTTATAASTAIAAVPIPEPITMTVKTIAASAAQVSSVALQTGTKLVQSIGKGG